MTNLKRITLNLHRQWLKSLILLVTIFILGFLLTGSIIVRNTILQTEHNLWSTMPRIAAISFDFDVSREMIREAGGDEALLDTRVTSREVIREIGTLPYVESFNYIFNHSLWNSSLQSVGESFNFFDEPSFWVVQGVFNPNLPDLDEGIIEIVEGRTFTEQDMIGVGEVALVSQDFAEVNNLDIGSRITLESRLYDDIDDVHNNDDWFNMERVVELEVFELEIIGFFDIVDDVAEEERYEVIEGVTYTFETSEAFMVRRLQNQIYVPINVIEASPSFDFEQVSQQEANGVEAQFLLYDPLDMPDFISEANEMLAGWWRMTDLSGNFGRITASMETMRWVADLLFWGGTTGSIIVLSLFMILFLYDRKKEVGIYLALGESKKKIVMQMISEVLLLTIVALSVSLFVGNVVTSHVSRQLLEQDIVRQMESEENRFWGVNNLERHNPGEMDLEDMLAHFEIELDGMAIFWVYGIGIVTVSLSTLASIVSVVKLNPKDVLM